MLLSVIQEKSHFYFFFPSGTVQDHQAQEGDVSSSRWRCSQSKNEPAERSQIQVGQGGPGPYQEGHPGEQTPNSGGEISRGTLRDIRGIPPPNNWQICKICNGLFQGDLKE